MLACWKSPGKSYRNTIDTDRQTFSNEFLCVFLTLFGENPGFNWEETGQMATATTLIETYHRRPLRLTYHTNKDTPSLTISAPNLPLKARRRRRRPQSRRRRPPQSTGERKDLVTWRVKPVDGGDDGRPIARSTLKILFKFLCLFLVDCQVEGRQVALATTADYASPFQLLVYARTFDFPVASASIYRTKQ